MTYFFATHVWLSGLIIVGLGTLLSALGPSLIRRYVTLERLSANNEIAGFKFATVGVLYAVLLAFVIIVVWQKYSDAENTVAQEAGAAATLYRLSYGMDDQTGPALRAALTQYLGLVISDDWPAMSQGASGASRSARQALDSIYATLWTSANRDNVPVMSEVLHQLDILTQTRRNRLVAAEGAVPGVIWVVLVGGAVVTIVFTFFFGTRNLDAQTMMTALLAALIFSELLIVVVIDRPFTGTVSVEPTPLANVLADFRPEPAAPPPRLEPTRR